MSADTKKAMDAAIEAHLADEHHDDTLILSGYILQAAGNGLSDTRNLLAYSTLEGQAGITTMGLLAYLQANAERTVFESDDDDN